MSDNDAKQIVMNEATKLAASLQNGKSGDPETQGRAIGLLVQMVKPLYAADFVTQQECIKSHEALVKSMAASRRTEAKRVKLNAGPFGFEGDLTPIITLALIAVGSVGGLVYVIWRHL
jgi:hypothetical protein